jgi:hypothetical protein
LKQHSTTLPVDLFVELGRSAAVAASGGSAGDLVGPFGDDEGDDAAA